MSSATETIVPKKRKREEGSNHLTAKRIRVNEEDLFTIVYSCKYVGGENNEHDPKIQFFRGTDCAASCDDLFSINQLRIENFPYKDFCTTIYIAEDSKKVALSIEGKSDRRLEFRLSDASNEYKESVLERLKSVFHHLALPGSNTKASHVCCSTTYL